MFENTKLEKKSAYLDIKSEFSPTFERYSSKTDSELFGWIRQRGFDNPDFILDAGIFSIYVISS